MQGLISQGQMTFQSRFPARRQTYILPIEANSNEMIMVIIVTLTLHDGNKKKEQRKRNVTILKHLNDSFNRKSKKIEVCLDDGGGGGGR